MHFAILDPADEERLISCEQAFYSTFKPIAGSLIQKLWNWDHNEQRLRTAIPYDEQIVYVVMDDQKKVIGGLAVNTLLRSLQSAEYGFRIPDTNMSGKCELLAFFMAGGHQNGTRFHRHFFREFCCHDLIQRGFHVTYGTTAPKPLPVYIRIGARILEERQLGNETRYFFAIDLAGRTSPPRTV